MRVKRRISRHKRFYRNIILVTCLLVVFMTIGYAAFQTNISFKAKGNIKEKTITVTDLINNVVTSGDGLYEDFTETGRYVYKGANPNNYIKLGDDIYRIIAIESDGTLKVMKNERIDYNLFDDARSCSEVAYVGPKRKTKTITNGSKTIYEIDIIMYAAGSVSSSGCSNWARRADLNVYLNETWYNTLQYSNLIQNHTWYVGGVNYSETNLQISVDEEKAYTWDGKIGLISATDYVKASTNSACTSISTYHSSSSCYNNSKTHNWIDSLTSSSAWTITPNSEMQVFIFGYSLGSDYAGGMTYAVIPAFFLSSDISFTGEGTSDNPYLLHI